LKVSRLKLASSEVTNAPLLVAVGRTGLPVILSTGMSNLAEVRSALGALAWGMRASGSPADASKDFAVACSEALSGGLLQDRVTLLHCTTQYPTPPEAVNLRAMQALTEEFGLPVGLSDHTTSTTIAAAAVALGATVIEKHFTLDRSLPGPDHVASLEPHELAEMVRNIRDVEAALGDGLKDVQQVEIENIAIARKSIVAAMAIRKGELFTEGNLMVKRPGGGISPYGYWSLLGQAAVKDFVEDEQISV
jgi:sialic acid synthase SpsE